MITAKAAAVCRPKDGESASGDTVGVWQDEASTLLAVVDGLGSGPPAAEASRRAVAWVAANRNRPLVEILTDCHKALHGTRGIVAALVRVEHRAKKLSFVGVGNVGFNADSRESMQPFSQNGVVGHRLPELIEFRYDCSPGDRLAIYTDGISSEFIRQGGLAALPEAAPETVAHEIVERFGSSKDDVAVAVLEVSGDDT